VFFWQFQVAGKTGIEIAVPIAEDPPIDQKFDRYCAQITGDAASIDARFELMPNRTLSLAAGGWSTVGAISLPAHAASTGILLL